MSCLFVGEGQGAGGAGGSPFAKMMSAFMGGGKAGMGGMGGMMGGMGGMGGMMGGQDWSKMWGGKGKKGGMGGDWSKMWKGKGKDSWSGSSGMGGMMGGMGGMGGMGKDFGGDFGGWQMKRQLNLDQNMHSVYPLTLQFSYCHGLDLNKHVKVLFC